MAISQDPKLSAEEIDKRKKRRERNLRYRKKKSLAPSAVQKIPPSPENPIPAKIDENPPPLSPAIEPKKQTSVLSLKIFETLLSVLLCLFISVLLVFFQADTYLEDGMSKALSYALSIQCETALLYLSASLRASYVSRALFMAIFLYTLGAMSYGVLKKESLKTDLAVSELAAESRREAVFERAKRSFDLFEERGQSKNAQKSFKAMEDLLEKLEKPKGHFDLRLYKIEAFGLVILRAIMMLLNALLVHRLTYRLKS
jgi:hypothetical protein